MSWEKNKRKWDTVTALNEQDVVKSRGMSVNKDIKNFTER